MKAALAVLLCIGCGSNFVAEQCSTWAPSGEGPPVPAGWCVRSTTAEGEQLVSSSSDKCIAVEEHTPCLILFEGERPYYFRPRVSEPHDRQYEQAALAADGSCPLTCEEP